MAKEFRTEADRKASPRPVAPKGVCYTAGHGHERYKIDVQCDGDVFERGQSWVALRALDIVHLTRLDPAMKVFLGQIPGGTCQPQDGGQRFSQRHLEYPKPRIKPYCAVRLHAI